MGQLLGNWKLEKNENWDEFMSAMGMNFVLRKVASKLTVCQEIIQNGDNWEINMTSTFKNKSIKFQLGVPFDDETMNGRKIKATFTLKDDVLILNQKGIKEGDSDMVVTRQVDENDQLIETFKIVQKNVVAVKTSKRYTP
ncbi:fatty acid-binding protein homolog 5 [Patella vulgata]|uniref:fatty acid-binding protein homolog 5 n=1 Tax=Patella vulgata TaxID=6465 RepID=UPI0024AA023E|nr:fatty acid-binding protein homolog 5 [Patella vulgata]